MSEGPESGPGELPPLTWSAPLCVGALLSPVLFSLAPVILWSVEHDTDAGSRGMAMVFAFSPLVLATMAGFLVLPVMLRRIALRLRAATIAGGDRRPAVAAGLVASLSLAVNAVWFLLRLV